jgi:protein TonB
VLRVARVALNSKPLRPLHHILDKGLSKPGNYVQAEYPGGDSSLGFLFSTNLRYPEQEKRKGIEGQVYVGFVVDQSGDARNFQVLKGLSPKCDEEALRVLNLMQPWQPATLNEEAVASKKVVPITFRLVSR